SCKVCYQDPKTHLIEARWPISYHLTIGANWTSGVYLLKIIAANGAETYATPLVVRAAHSSATALVNLPVMTYQAYNLWGGYSLYQHKAGPMLPGRAVKVS